MILLQQFIVNPAWFLGTMGTSDILEAENVGGAVWVNMDILFGLGITMLIMAFCLGLRTVWLMGLSLVAVLFSQGFFQFYGKETKAWSAGLRLLLVPGQSGMLLVNYPLIPWVGVTGLGVAAGRWLIRHPAPRVSSLLGAGLLCFVVFIVLRWIGGFGNFQPPAGDHRMDFLNLIKYPPALVFLLFTIGVNLLLAALLSLFCHRLSRTLRCTPLSRQKMVQFKVYGPRPAASCARS